MIDKAPMEKPDCKQRISAALEVARFYGSFDGEFHKTWVIDQMVRALTGEQYDHWIEKVTQVQFDGAIITLEWDTGIAP